MVSAKGHEPVRTCIVCSTKGPKRSLLRIAADCERETAFLDPLQRARGRGAYVCPQCLPRLHFTKRVQKAFRNRVKALSREERTSDSSHGKSGSQVFNSGRENKSGGSEFQHDRGMLSCRQ